jgi:hypothetical protein
VPAPGLGIDAGSALAMDEGDDEPVEVPEAPLVDTPVPGSVDTPQEILLDLRFGRLAGTTVQAYSNGTEPLLPVVALFQLAEIDVALDSLGTVRATLYPGEVSVEIRREGGNVLLDGRPIRIPEGALQATGDELFLSAPLLGEILGVTIVTDWVALVTTVMDPEGLPVAQRLAREARWSRIRAGRTSRLAAPLLDLNNPALGGAILDWSVANNVRSPDESFTYSLAMGARAFDGSLRLSSRSLGPVNLGQNQFDATYERVFEGQSWLTQLRVGDGLTTGPRLRGVRGLALSNAPFFRGGDFSSEVFQGRVGPGWEVELRQSGQVVDLTRADEQGAFALDIPLRYGENAIQVVAFGPHGEVITTDRVLLAGQELIPEGAFEWGLSGGQCRDDRCDATGNLDLRYGVNNKLTLRGGTEASTGRDGSTLLQPYAQASGLVLPSLQLTGEYLRQGFTRGGATFSPSPWLRVRAAHTRFAAEGQDPVFNAVDREATTEADVFFRPRPSNPRLFIRGAYTDQALDGRDLSRIQGSINVPIGRVLVETGLRRITTDLELGPAQSDNFQFGSVTANFRLGRRHRFYARGEIEVLEAELMNRLRGQVTYQINNGLSLNVATTWQRNFGASLSVTLNAYLNQFQSSVQAVAAEDAASQVTQFSQGTIYWDEGTSRVDFAPGPGVEQGGLSGFVFMDSNGNGVRDEGEEGMPGVRLVVGGKTVTSDDQGRHTSWDLIPYQQVEVWADSTSIMDPTLVPQQSRVRVDVPPSSFGRVDIPLTVSRQIAGQVSQVQDASTAEGLALPYAELELVNTETGDIREFQAFSDGQFYEAAVRPGTYEVRLARDYMVRARLLPQGSWPIINVGPQNPFEIIGPIEVRAIRLPPQVQDDGWIEAAPPEQSSSQSTTQVERGGERGTERAGSDRGGKDRVESPESGDPGSGGSG